MVLSVLALNIPSQSTWPSATTEIQEFCFALITTLMEPFWSWASLPPGLSASADGASAAFTAWDEGVLVVGAGALDEVRCAAGLGACCSEVSARVGLCLIQKVQPPTTRISATSASSTGAIDRFGFRGGELSSFS